MSSRNRNDIIPLLLGGAAFLLFATKPYVLDLIEPAKSIGQVIGENAKDLMDSLKGEDAIKPTNSKREIWSNGITILAFILMVLSLFFSLNTFQKGRNKVYVIAGLILSIAGLGLYISHLAIGLIGFIVIAVLVVAFVLYDGTSF